MLGFPQHVPRSPPFEDEDDYDPAAMTSPSYKRTGARLRIAHQVAILGQI
jgi:hypothetical protein